MIQSLRAVALTFALLTPTVWAQPIDLSNGADNLETFVRMRGDSSGKDTLTWWYGSVFAVVPDQRPIKIFGFEGYNIARMVKDDKGAWTMLSREYAVYRDPTTNQILTSWDNPLNGRTVQVFDVQNDPVNNRFGDGSSGRILPIKRLGPDVIMGFDVPLGYPNPVDPKRFPLYSTGETYVGSEHFGFFVEAKDVDNRALTSIPMRLSWARQSPWMPWMEMADAPGVVLFSAWGKKIDSFDQLSPDFLAHVQSKGEFWLKAPEEFSEPNDTTWGEFLRQVLEPMEAQKAAESKADAGRHGKSTKPD